MASADASPPTRDEALRIIQDARRRLDALVADMTDAQLRKPATLGGGSWSIKDLIGHLASWETRALSWLREPESESRRPYPSTDDFETLLEREAARGDRMAGLDLIQHEIVHAHGVYDMEVDTSTTTASECAALIKERLQNGVRPTAFDTLRTNQ